MQRNRILVMGQDRDAAYAIRNLFESERHDIDVSIEFEVVREALVERAYHLLLLDSRVCKDEDFDLVDFPFPSYELFHFYKTDKLQRDVLLDYWFSVASHCFEEPEIGRSRQGSLFFSAIVQRNLVAL